MKQQGNKESMESSVKEGRHKAYVYVLKEKRQHQTVNCEHTQAPKISLKICLCNITTVFTRM